MTRFTVTCSDVPGPATPAVPPRAITLRGSSRHAPPHHRHQHRPLRLRHHGPDGLFGLRLRHGRQGLGRAPDARRREPGRGRAEGPGRGSDRRSDTHQLAQGHPPRHLAAPQGGRLRPQGGRQQAGPLLDAKGDCTGTIAQGKDTIGIIKIGKTVYLRPQGTSKWTKTNTDSADGKDLASVCDLNNFLGGFQGEDTEAKKGATTKVDGRPAIVLTEKDGAESYTMDVATSGKPYLLKMVTVGGDSPGTLSFSHFGEPVHAVAPTRTSIAA
ncbi:hypothetical protein [Streptomyces violascens]|uniref:hypothetical protein n=1 Tax=Streptomyces violascens TaxID=67381 RepID=UPI001CFDCECF|nr:hypothetical protein [Streptomyces violascens]